MVINAQLLEGKGVCGRTIRESEGRVTRLVRLAFWQTFHIEIKVELQHIKA